MPQQTDSAARTRLCKINKDLEERKLRVAGRVFAYDATTGLIMLIDNEHALLVDVSLALDSRSREWAAERLSTIMAIGDLERTEDPLTIPSTPTRSPALKLSRHLVLRAILVVPSPDLDLTLWNAVLEEDEEEKGGEI